MSGQLQLLLEMQATDLLIDQLTAQKKEAQERIAGVRDDVQAAHARVEETKKELVTTQKDRKLQEVELESKETEIRKHQAELNQVKTNEAYAALVKKVDELKNGVGQTEEAILGLMDRADELQKRLKHDEAGVKDAEAKGAVRIRDLEGEVARLDQAIADAAATRAAASAKVEPMALRKYDRIRARLPGAAVVPVTNYLCGGCHMAVPPQLVTKILKPREEGDEIDEHAARTGTSESELIECLNCTRILYVSQTVSQITG